MADTEQQVGMLEETQSPHTQVLVENGEIVTVAETHEADNVGMGEDILQQALDEASGAYDNTDVEYTTEENIAVVADGNGTLSDANGVTYSYVTAVPTETQLENQTITQAIPTAHTTQPGQSLIRINPNAQTHVTGVNQVVALPPTQSPNITVATNQQQQQQPPPPPPPPPPQTPHVVQVIRRPQQVVQQVIQPQTIQPNIMEAISPKIQQTHVQLSQTDSGTPGSITVLTNSGVGGEPLGSSGNPIRIIQQGNKYTSVQQLTPEQVAQIMQVVQQQQLAQTTKAGGGSSVLFNPQTQTRIVYRVIYPSELHSKTTSASGTGVLSAAAGKTTAKTITVPTQMLTLGSASTSGSSSSTRRPYRKRLKDEDDKVDGPALTREEKELRKKHRPRTRSGRVSRPPKHMIQDYKHIHHLDWEEDQDDSDGGYSDYKITDDEDGEKRNSLDSGLLDTNLNSSKPKKFSCEKCEKAYIGAAGLARHYRLNPDHGNAEDVCPAVMGKSKLSLNGVDGLASLADDSSTQDSISSTASLPTTMASIPVISTPIALPTISTTEASSEVHALTGLAPNTASASASALASAPTPLEPVVIASPSKAAAPRGAARAKQHYAQENTPTRRKFRLKELVRLCTDEELMEVVLPRLSRVITTWEFLLMKVERGRPSRPHIGDMLTEYESLHKQVEKMCGDYLHPLPDPADGHVERHNNVLQMKNAVLAESLGLNMGKYSVREVPKRDESARQYKLITSQNVGPGSGKRTIQLVTPDQLVIADNPLKRQRISEPCITSVSQTSGIVTVSLANKVFSDEAKLTAEPASESVVPSFSQSQAEVHATSQSSSTMPVNIAVEVTNTISDKNVLAEVTPHVIMPIGSEELNAVSVHDDVVLGSDMKAESEEAETIIAIATGHGPVEDSITGVDMDVCSSALPESMQLDDQGMTDSEVAIPANEEPEEVPASTCTATELTHGDPVLVPAENGSTDQLEQVVQVQQIGDDGVISQQQDEQLHSQVLCEMAESGDAPVQTVMVAAGVGEQQTTQQVLSEDGQTVLYTNDGGQTFYQQATDMVTDEAQSQQMTMEASGPQFVSMETPEGLVEGQLVTNEDGTQFLIPHQETQDQALYQTPEGFIVIQNQDGTLRILSNGDPQIPLETAQALLAGESQIEENTMEQAT